MAIIINNGVENIEGTPGAISGVFSDRPAAPDLAEGTLYFSTDTTTIYQVNNGAWIVYTGGGGGGVSAVTGTKPITSSGGATPDISISQSTATTDGYLNFQDWNTFNNKVGGSGVATRVAFWSATNQISSNTNLFWDNTNNRLALGTNTPLFQLHATGEILTNTGVRIAVNSSKTGVYPYDNFGGGLSFWAGANNIATFRLTNPGGQLYFFNAPHTYNNSLPQLPTSSVNIKGSISPTGVNSVDITQLLINPDIDQTPSGNLWGSGTLRGVYFNPNIANLNTSQLIAFESTAGDVIMTQGSYNAFRLDFTNLRFDLGDIASGNYVRVDSAFNSVSINANNSMFIYCSNAGFSATGDTTLIGDIDGRTNSTTFGVDDNGQKLLGSANLISTVGTLSTDRIKINIGGIEYLIVLERA
jgi:hypothetical protein